jgi:23S rRNA (guanosine2251-2'-O)-methyltransferase
MRRGPQPRVAEGGKPRFWGKHAVYAALDNPNRIVRRIWGTREALGEIVLPPGVPVTFAEVTDMAKLVAKDSPHQGIVIEVEPLEDIWIGDLLTDGENDHRPLLILDQVTDPHNVGAILRSAVAFNALGIVTQDRHAPPETGVLARSASGALEMVPWVRVVNLARTLDEIGEAGFWRIGLKGDTDITLEGAISGMKSALVLGSEGEGMRQNTEAHCDVLARLPISDRIESLNVSNAAAIALYAAVTSSNGR